jgi:hypothetical protein
MADRQHHPNEAPKRRKPDIPADEDKTRRMREDDDLEEGEPIILPDESDEGNPRERD